ncbi:FAD-binding oxidoreductase [Paenibacillus psychroresistens]|uniref:FAD-binding oxidoreductase n=1 Tax=Paenibacillus psychroresistens TaxID=1778678 RepID=A0A6B8RNG9_9BACL|nr:FAD-binding oxidoreductase [Paenibacillus psychroresistens]QGQ97870.1 FAD-binding oxidoreductase [Paenibacillus psychroresistens]
MKKTLVLLLLIVFCLFTYIRTNSADQDPYLIADFSRLFPVKVERVVKGKEEAQLVRLLKEAREKHLTVSIAGQRHSQGGHTYYKDGVVIDMTPYNKILAFDSKSKTITVQAGATWKDIQDYINPFGLSIKTMQSQNVFTVGGSVSINAHGRDIRNGSLIKSVESFRLLLADGQVKQVSRTENSELFPLALGGYGLFGVILDVTLSLTVDEVYRTTTESMKVTDYSRYYLDKVRTNSTIHLHLARISVAPESFLTEMYATNYTVDESIPLKEINKLRTQEKGVIPAKLLFNLNRSFDWGKNAFWDLQEVYFVKQNDAVISRNNAMRSESGFMDYDQPGKNDLLQEYFIPVEDFAGFVDDMKSVLRAEELNLLNITVRYVNKDKEAELSYAQADMFALVCLFNTSLTTEGQLKMKKGIQLIIDKVIKHRGTYYLPYAAYPTLAQFQKVYPNYSEFFAKKDFYDPNHMFMNYFYEAYKGD